MGSKIPDSVLQQELNAVKAQLQEEREENATLMGIREAKMKEINQLKQELEELKRGQWPVTPPPPSPLRELSPLRERQSDARRMAGGASYYKCRSSSCGHIKNVYACSGLPVADNKRFLFRFTRESQEHVLV